MSATCFAFTACSAIMGHTSSGHLAVRLSSTEFQPHGPEEGVAGVRQSMHDGVRDLVRGDCDTL